MLEMKSSQVTQRTTTLGRPEKVLVVEPHKSTLGCRGILGLVIGALHRAALPTVSRWLVRHHVARRKIFVAPPFASNDISHVKTKDRQHGSQEPPLRLQCDVPGH